MMSALTARRPTAVCVFVMDLSDDRGEGDGARVESKSRDEVGTHAHTHGQRGR